jgi:hypothetical protein
MSFLFALKFGMADSLHSIYPWVLGKRALHLGCTLALGNVLHGYH